MTFPPDPATRTSSRGGLVRGGRALLIAELVGYAVPLFVLPHLTRRLGVEIYGRLQFVMALGMLAGIVADPGLGRVATRRSARRVTHVPRLLARMQPLRCATAVLGGGALVAAAIGMGASRETVSLFALQAGVIVAQSFSVDAYLLGIGASAWIGYARAATSLMYGAGVLLWVRDAGDANVVLLVTLISSVVLACAGTLRLRAHFGPLSWAPALRPARVMFGESLGYGLSSVMSLIYARIDVVMLRWFQGEAAVGLYSAAVRLTEAALSALGVVHGVLFPRAVSAGATSSTKPSGYAQRALRLVLGVVLPAGVGAAVAGGPILAWVAGPAFEGGGVVMAILGVATILGALASTLSTFGLAAYGLSRIVFFSTLLGALVNALGNLVAIPYWGPAGAALTTVLAQAAVALVGLQASRGRLRISIPRAIQPWVWPCVAMSFCVLLVGYVGGSAAAQLGIGVVSYVGGTLLFRSLRRGERQALAAQLAPFRTG